MLSQWTHVRSAKDRRPVQAERVQPQSSLETVRPWPAGPVVSFKRNAPIYRENHPIDACYRVISGAVRTQKILADGRRQIAGFYLPGDVVGIEFGKHHLFSAETIVETKIVALKFGSIDHLKPDPRLEREMLSLVGQELQRMHNHVMVLAKTAPERVANFLLSMATSCEENDELSLPMPRQDIADYLGLSIETVSRVFTQLTNCSAIELATSKRVIIRHPAVLSQMND
jgi:CRP/FNR family nitrogen fixation transcriptional regulator